MVDLSNIQDHGILKRNPYFYQLRISNVCKYLKFCGILHGQPEAQTLKPFIHFDFFS